MKKSPSVSQVQTDVPAVSLFLSVSVSLCLCLCWTGKDVILEIPALPVMTGSDVTLCCTPKEGERRKSYFFRDNVTLGSGPEGKWILSNVQRSDEGLYSCHTDIHPRSPQSRLRVRGQGTDIISCLKTN